MYNDIHKMGSLSPQIRSDIIHKKHVSLLRIREIEHMISYEELLRQQRQKNEEKLFNMFKKNKALEQKKKNFEESVTRYILYSKIQWIKLQNDKDYLRKQKEKDDLIKLDQSLFYHEQNGSPRKSDIQKYQLKKKQVLTDLEKKMQRKNSLDVPEHQPQYLKMHYTVENEKVDSVKAKQKYDKFFMDDVGKIKMDILNQKIQNAEKVKKKQIVNTVVKIKQHDDHIREVQVRQQIHDVFKANSQVIANQQERYYREKMEYIDHKIQQIQGRSLNSSLNKDSKEQYRKQIKAKGEHLLLNKIGEKEKNFSGKSERINLLKHQKSLSDKDRFFLISQLQQEKEQVQKQLNLQRYPLLNSKNFEDQLVQSRVLEK